MFMLQHRLSLMLLIFALLPAFSQAQTLRDTTLMMDDGVILDALYVYPSTPAPTEGHPAVLLVHGFGGSKSNNNAAAINLARDGYVATSYSVRGQGASEGLFDFFTSERILDDLRAMIAFTKDLPDVRKERVAVMGASQGGLHAWNAAAYDMGVRAVVSIIANGRARENWLEHEAMNWTFAAATITANVRFDPAVLDSITRARESGDYSYLRGFMETASTKRLEKGVTTPTAIFVSYYDGFFDQNAALRQFRDIAGPKRIMLYPAGHSRPSDRSQLNYYNDVIDRWFAYWLKDDAQAVDVASPDSAVVFFDAASGERRVLRTDEHDQWLDEGSELPESIYPLALYFTSEGLSHTPETAPSSKAISYINVLGSQPVVFRSPPLSNQALRIAPRAGSFTVRGGGSGSQIQFNLLLYDVDPVANTRRAITRTHVQLPGTTDTSVTVELNSVLHTIAPGHVIEARVDAGMALFPDQQNNFGNFVVGPVDNSTTRFFCGGDDPWSHITLLMYDMSPTRTADLPVAQRSRIEGSWPQPVRSSAMIAFTTAQSGRCRLSIYDSRGREVAVLHDGELRGGRHRAQFRVGDLPAGLYLAVLRAGTMIDRKKLLLVR